MNKLLILAVEDDVPVLNLITTTLKAQGYRFLSAQTGEAAVMETASHNPDIVLLDLGLPDLDGIEVIRRIRLVHDVVRITLWVGGYDHRGLEIARACDGLVEEGSIANEVLHYGNLYEEFAFSLVLTPPEETA